jgi:tRNA nucleotidyltransferase (CCA-adding enzyme)
MKQLLNRLPKEILDLIYLSSKLAVKLDYRIYLVGGFVRDLILGLPNLDVDIAIEGNGLDFAAELARCLQARLIRHRRFGTATVAWERFKVDIATAREEFYEKPAALPSVRAGTIKDDLKRRDFTINAMAIDISENNFGHLLDFFAGRDDLREGRIRILHNLSFIDDPIRILRAIRFEQRYNFRIERHTLRLLKEAVHTKMLQRVSGPRVKDELVLLLKEARVLKCIIRMQRLNIFPFISPKLRWGKEKLYFLKSIEKVIIIFTRQMPKKRNLDTWLMYFIGLTADLDKKELKNICTRFGFSRSEQIRILSYKQTVKVLQKRLREKIRPSRIYRYLQPLSYEVILLIKASSRNKVVGENIEDFFRLYNNMRFSINGDDLLDLGIKPGPEYKHLLKKVFYARLDGAVTTKEEELEYIRAKHLKARAHKQHLR